jgi:hypothetical protein
MVAVRTRRCAALVITFMLPLPAIAQGLTPPRLEIDFSGGSVPLSPWLTAAIALLVVAVGCVALRRRARHGHLAGWAAVAAAGTALALAWSGVPLVSPVHAIPPQVRLTLVGSPTLFTDIFVGDVHVTNGLTQPVTITAVTYDTGSYDFYVDAAGTTCVAGTTLLPGQECIVRILSLG